MNQPRRRFLTLAATGALLAAIPGTGHAQSSAAAFVQKLGTDLVQIVNAPGDAASKRSQLLPVIEQNVAVDEIGRFCIGHYWQAATEAQRAQYLSVFHAVLMNSILSHLGSYRGVKFTIGQSQSAPDGTHVETTIFRPGEAPANVEWVVGPDQKVVDVVAEGTSLRTTQRGDYTSYLARHGGDVALLIAALQRQVARNS